MRKTNRTTTSKMAPTVVEGSAAAMREVRGKVLRFTTSNGLQVFVDMRVGVRSIKAA